MDLISGSLLINTLQTCVSTEQHLGICSFWSNFKRNHTHIQSYSCSWGDFLSLNQDWLERPNMQWCTCAVTHQQTAEQRDYQIQSSRASMRLSTCQCHCITSKLSCHACGPQTGPEANVWEYHVIKSSSLEEMFIQELLPPFERSVINIAAPWELTCRHSCIV